MPVPARSSLAARLSRHATRPERAFVLDVPFQWRAWASSQRVTWDKDIQAAVWRGEQLPEALEPFAAQPFSWEWRQQEKINPGLDLAIPALEPAWSARPHQKEASSAMVAAYRQDRVGFLLADDVGVGKTLSAWDFALSQRALRKVLIVTTAPAVPHWRNTLLHAGTAGKQVLILNYDRLGKVFNTTGKELSSRRRGKRKRVAKQGDPEAFDLIIFDEAHKGKNLASARSTMMRRLAARATFVVWASATAGQNPLELAYLAALLAQITGHRLSDLTSDFEQWCKSQDIGVSRGKFGRWEWRKSAKALKKMNGWLFAGKVPAGIRRLPQDIAGWKALERQLMPVAMEPQARLDYAKAWSQFRADRMALPTKGSRKRKEIGLVAQLRFRQKGSWLRIPATLGLAADHLDNGQRVAISVAFHDTLEEMARQLRAAGIEPAVIHGKLSPDEKEAQRLRFQTGQTPVVLFTVEEAISLHQGEHEDAPRTMLVHDLRWSALQMAQVEGRCHRDGKFARSQALKAQLRPVPLDLLLQVEAMGHVATGKPKDQAQLAREWLCRQFPGWSLLPQRPLWHAVCDCQ